MRIAETCPLGADLPIEECRCMNVRTWNLINHAGCRTVRQVSHHTASWWLKHKWCGDRTLKELHKILLAHGLDFWPEHPLRVHTVQPSRFI